MCVCIYEDMHIYKNLLALSAEWLRNDTLVVKSTPGPHILFSKYHFPVKGIRVPKRNG